MIVFETTACPRYAARIGYKHVTSQINWRQPHHWLSDLVYTQGTIVIKAWIVLEAFFPSYDNPNIVRHFGARIDIISSYGFRDAIVCVRMLKLFREAEGNFIEVKIGI
jgi:hypothetical protein